MSIDFTVRQPEPTFVAHHEAGHAVAALALGVRVVSASIIPTASTRGRVVTAPTGREMVELGRYEEVAVITFAGPISSDCRHSGRAPGDYFGGGSADDAHEARRMNVAGSEERAHGIVDQHGAAIDRIVRELLAHGTLEEAAIMSLFQG